MHVSNSIVVTCCPRLHFCLALAKMPGRKSGGKNEKDALPPAESDDEPDSDSDVVMLDYLCGEMRDIATGRRALDRRETKSQGRLDALVFKMIRKRERKKRGKADKKDGDEDEDGDGGGRSASSDVVKDVGDRKPDDPNHDSGGGSGGGSGHVEPSCIGVA